MTDQFKHTQIDRAQCTRKVPMKILVLGHSRTGTFSMRTALLRLGYNDVYHAFEIFWGNKSDLQLWGQAIEAKFEGKGKPFTKEQWDSLLGHCQAVTDTPCNMFGKELTEAYPNAKVILTTRDPDAWHRSMKETIAPDRVSDKRGVFWKRLFLSVIPGFKADMRSLKLMFKYAFGEDFAENGKQRFINHNEEIRSLVPKENLLEFQAKEGWEPLCKFLGEEIPDEPFPHSNEAKILTKELEKLRNSLFLKALSYWLGYFCLFGVAVFGTRKLIFAGGLQLLVHSLLMKSHAG